uniref:Uncharacterized protein n=1 Tax=Chenopodium quinoa TaxID=63459 RepID=A0A803L0J4_CHEQI
MAETLSNSPKKHRPNLNHNPSELDRLSSLPDIFCSKSSLSSPSNPPPPLPPYPAVGSAFGSSRHCFVSKPSVLHKANIGVWPQILFDGSDLTHLPEFLRGISSVKSMHLVDNLALFNSVNGIDHANVWLNFHNLTHLSLIVSGEHVIWDAPIPSHLLSRLKNIEISGIKGQVEYMFCRRLFKVPRTSLTCKVEFDGAYIIASVDGSGNGSVVSQIDWEGPGMITWTRMRNRRQTI